MILTCCGNWNRVRNCVSVNFSKIEKITRAYGVFSFISISQLSFGNQFSIIVTSVPRFFRIICFVKGSLFTV